MTTKKYIKIVINYDMSLPDLIKELQDLNNKYPNLITWNDTEIEFKTEEKGKIKNDNNIKLTAYITPHFDNKHVTFLYPNSETEFAYQTFKNINRNTKSNLQKAKRKNRHAKSTD